MHPAEPSPESAQAAPVKEPQQLTAATGNFNVYDRDQFCNRRISFNRRDFYKIALLLGTGRLNYATKGILLDRPALVFSNPLVPYSWEPISEAQSGYFCLFTDDFLASERSVSLQESPLFKLNSDSVYFVSEEQQERISQLFRTMLTEMATGYVHKKDLMRTYVHLLLHEALKMQPQTAYYQHPNAASRIVGLFQELLERQFPIDAPDHGLKLRTPSDFARQLSVHVNHLNKAVRDLTGKTTGAHITARLITEAQALLQHTTWTVAEIAYSLGFEYPSYFNTFFRKATGTTPSAMRAAADYYATPPRPAAA